MVFTQIQGRIEEIIESSEVGAFLVDIGLKKGKKSVLYIKVDTDKGISLSECTKISREINQWLEEAAVFDFPYRLEVSSPGIGSPLKLRRQYLQNVDRNLHVRLHGNNEYRGKLVQVTPDHIVLIPSSKKKHKKNNSKNKEDHKQEVTILFSEIASATVVLPF